MDRADLSARLALLAVPGVSQPRALRLLLQHGGGVEALHALRREDAQVRAALSSQAVRERVRRALHAIDANSIQIIPWDDADYPDIVRQRLGDHAPVMLFAIGDTGILSRRRVAVVGCRRASEYGLDIADQIGGAVARAGGCVVSGLAVGIDAAAHAAALNADGATIAVLGCGVDVYYPHDNMALQDRIAAYGLLLSELLPGEPPRKFQFPHRNRIIAALSEPVVVVEAGARSGAVATGNHAVAQGGTVYCVINAMDHPNVQGILQLLRDGASAYTGARDLLEYAGLIGTGAALPHEAREQEAPPSHPLHAQVWGVLGSRTEHIDVIVHETGMAAAQALGTLLELELDGRVQQLPGRRFARVRPRVVR